MRVRFWLALVCVISVAFALGQRPVMADDPPQQQPGTGGIRGVVVDENNKPVVSLPVRLYQVEHVNIEREPRKQSLAVFERFRYPATGLTEKLIATVNTDSQGKFTFSNIKPGSYLLRGSRRNVGFIYQELEIKADQMAELGTIKMSKP